MDEKLDDNENGDEWKKQNQELILFLPRRFQEFLSEELLLLLEYVSMESSIDYRARRIGLVQEIGGKSYPNLTTGDSAPSCSVLYVIAVHLTVHQWKG